MKKYMGIIQSVWLLGLILMVMFANELSVWITGPIVFVILLVAILRDVVPVKDRDERERHLGYLSSHIAFYCFIFLLIFFALVKYFSKGENMPSEYYALLLVPLTAKFLTNIYKVFDSTKAARFTGYLFGTAWFLFAFFSHGATLMGLIESAPFLTFILLAWATRYKKIQLFCGIVYIALGIGTTVLFIPGQPNIANGILIFTLVPLPVLIGGIALVFKRLRTGRVTQGTNS